MTFQIKNINRKTQHSMQTRGVWSHECPVSFSELRLLEINYYNFEGKVKVGEMIVHTSAAESVIMIFRDLYQIRFSIDKMELIDEYDGDDILSMEANNSSCFNHRKIYGSDLISMHSYGLAIDINPVQNPCIQEGSIVPQAGESFLNRQDIRPGMVEPIVDIFFRNGFTIWGGNWSEPIDYHHFQVPREKIKSLGIG